ncbi:MAG: hypothetical protein COA84_14805 [Robiginitomaculum sp.]|nr:MAG: hypothetical protein COA84_14805 [Robiginitomaculum sp.]
MAQLIKKENITIVTGTYTDNQGNEKKRYKTIAELITMKGDDGSEYQFGEIWGPHGVTKFNVYAQEDNNNNQQNNNQGQQQQQQNNGGFQQMNQQQNNNQQQNSHNFNNNQNRN